MKRYGHLYERIFTYDNLYLAILNASKGKRKRKSVMRILNDMDGTISRIQANPHISGRYTRRTTTDKASGKEREILIPPFYPDQIIHHALIQVIYPILMKGTYEWCCASIRGRGGLYASEKVRKILKTDRKARYFAKLDVRKFYPSIDREILKSKIRNRIKDLMVLKLSDSIIDSVDNGIPIGNYTSQIFANFYLQDFDHFVKERLKVRHYVRYMDDMLVIGSNKRKLASQVMEMKIELKGSYHLITHDNEEVHPISDDGKSNDRFIDFVGFRHYRNRTTIRRRTFRRIRRLVIRMNSYVTIKRAMSFMSYLGYLIHSDSMVFIKNYIHFKIRNIRKTIGGQNGIPSTC